MMTTNGVCNQTSLWNSSYKKWIGMPVLLALIRPTTPTLTVCRTKITNQLLLTSVSLPVSPCKTPSCAKLFTKVPTHALVKTFKRNRGSSLGPTPTSYWARGSTDSRLESLPLLVPASQPVLKKRPSTWSLLWWTPRLWTIVGSKFPNWPSGQSTDWTRCVSTSLRTNCQTGNWRLSLLYRTTTGSLSRCRWSLTAKKKTSSPSRTTTDI